MNKTVFLLPKIDGWVESSKWQCNYVSFLLLLFVLERDYVAWDRTHCVAEGELEFLTFLLLFSRWESVHYHSWHIIVNYMKNMLQKGTVHAFACTQFDLGKKDLSMGRKGCDVCICRSVSIFWEKSGISWSRQVSWSLREEKKERKEGNIMRKS